MEKVTCGKCAGKGTLKHFSHVMAGTCFPCNGKGFKMVKNPKPEQNFLLWMIQDGEWVKCSHAKTKKAAEKWLTLPGTRKFTLEGEHPTDEIMESIWMNEAAIAA
jgi:hypothetical protein